MDICVVLLVKNPQDAKFNYPRIKAVADKLKFETICVYYSNQANLTFNLPQNSVLRVPSEDIEAAIRAALMWIPSMISPKFQGMIFTYGESPATDYEIKTIANKITASHKYIKTDNAWGISLAEAVLHGWDKDKRCNPPPSENEDLVAIGKAMRGEPVSRRILVRATKETMPTSVVSIMPPGALLKAYPATSSQFCDELLCDKEHGDNTQGYVTIMELIDDLWLTHTRKYKLKNSDVLAVVGNCLPENLKNRFTINKPFRVLYSEQEICVGLYGALPKESQ